MLVNGICRSCGRDFVGKPEDDDFIDQNGPCPEVDECPSYFEEVGIRHPDYPECWPVADAKANEGRH